MTSVYFHVRLFFQGIVTLMDDLCIFSRSFILSGRRSINGLPLWKKGMETIKQPVFVSIGKNDPVFTKS